MCSACHGADARGGQLGGPNLLRSQLVLDDKDGELIIPVVQNGPPGPPPMPPIPMARRGHQGDRRLPPQPAGAGHQPGRPAARSGDRAEHPGRRRQGRRRRSSPRSARAATRRPAICRASRRGWPARRRCRTCGCRAAWRGRARARRAGPPPRRPSRSTATVTLASGEKLAGRLLRLDDFLVTLLLEDGTPRTIPRTGASAEDRGAGSAARRIASCSAGSPTPTCTT